MNNKAYLSYLPEYLGRIREIRALGTVIDDMLAEAEAGNDIIVREGIVQTAENEGLKKWEELFRLPSSGSTESRRAAILACMTGTAPFTMKSVKEIIESVCGENTVRLEYGQSAYTLNVIIQTSIINRTQLIRGILERVLPANIEFNINYDYNKHSTLAAKTHAQLAEYTHSQLKTEEI
ncbi:MAG: DUF2313 domain-containing protein [Firmicutes bacterium]|nr:DUF2313 domain-containing protein [Bacillota bacterium]